MIMRTRRTIKASRTAKGRKRISAMSRFNRATRPVRASRPIRAARQKIINYLNFSELDDAQKEQAVEVFRESGTAYEWYSEDQMYWYEENLKELADEYSKKYGLTIHEDKLYWQSNSQGPYPEWNLENVFDTFSWGDLEISFWGKGTDVRYSVEQYNPETGYMEDDVDDSEMSETARAVVAAAQEFIDEVWDRIESVCRDYPDDEWCYDTLEANDYEFEVDANGDVVGMA